MRNLNPTALAKIAQTHGNEPVVILDIAWVKDGKPLRYADRDIDGVLGRILEVSNLDNVVNISHNDDSQEITVTLDDTDGSIKAIMDVNDIHKRDVWVYQWFEGLDFDGRFLLFRGKINSPVTWREGDRTVSFTVISQLEDNEIGFSPEDGQFTDIPADLIGVAWPMLFGTVTEAKTVRLTSRLSGILGDGIGFPDFNLVYRRAALMKIVHYLSPGGYFYEGLADYYKNSTYYDQAVQVKETHDEQAATWRDTVRVFGGETFPRGELRLDLGAGDLIGHFEDNVFHISKGIHPAIKSGKKLVTPHAEMYWPTLHVGNYAVRLDPYPTGNIIGDNAGYTFVDTGTSVKISSAEPQRYVVSIVPGRVLQVTAQITLEGQTFVQAVPEDLYTVSTETYGEVTAVMITLHDALSKRDGEGWGDDIYVTFQSDVGPNTVDILQHLIETYTDFAIDVDSFNHVRDRVTNYPSNFALYDRKNVVDVLREIAWQARCRIYLKDGTYYLHYLSEEHEPVATITEDDVLQGTMELGHTDTEDLVTKMVCEWAESAYQDDPYKTILRHNIRRYGTHEESYDYYIYDFSDAVIKSATFWLIRYANTWKKLRFQTPLTLLNVESLDTVLLDFETPYVANQPVKALVESVTYDSENNTLQFECWCPVKAGMMEPYIFAYPADVDEYATFPTDWEIQHGPDGELYADVETTSFLKIAMGSNLPSSVTNSGLDTRLDDPYGLRYSDDEGEAQDRTSSSRGSHNPSDIGDRSPGPKTIRPAEAFGESNSALDSPTANGGVLPQPDGYGGQSSIPGAPANGPDAGSGSNGDSGFDPNNLPDPDALPDNACLWDVEVIYVDPVTHVSQGGWPYPEGYKDCGTVGAVVNGALQFDNPEVFTFNSYESAQAFISQMEAWMDSESAVVCESFPYTLRGPKNRITGRDKDTSTPPCTDPVNANNDQGMVGYQPYGNSAYDRFASWSGGNSQIA